MTLTLEPVELIVAEWKALPPVENRQRPVSKQEAIKRLAKDSVDLQKRGYTREPVTAVRKEKGLEIGLTTLKSDLQRAKPTKKTETPAVHRQGPTPERELGREKGPLLAAGNSVE